MASSITLHGASSSSLSTSSRPYDVFLNFRGDDTRDIFICHLYDALKREGIYTYVDEQLRCGEEISEALFKVIKESKIAIVVLSENYASSTWCLRELVEILESMETKHILPVFYKVDPADVRHQRKSFGEALAKHEGRGDTVQSWKAVLTKVANLSGFHLEKGSESEFINKIVQEVSKMLSPTCLNISANSPVGIESSVDVINKLLSIGVHDKRMVGIFGVGGIGKTTIAEVIYDSISHQFEDKCFLQNVSETSKRVDGLLNLQEKLLSQILHDSHLKVHTVHQGKDVIKKRLCMKKVLLVLDDVDESDQLEALSGELDWFGLESRIIITTRDEHLLATHGVDLRHKMNELQDCEALKVFSRHAFHSDKPIDDFVELTNHALHYAGGNPLALRVVGSNLYGRDIKHWKSELEKYKRIPPRNIYEILKISYDGLEENEKNIFLDIACFFKGEHVKYVTHILNSCEFYPESGIRVLIDKSLITINIRGQLVMHDLLQDMGREIVRQESPKEPGKRSRLWFHKDVRDVLEENMGTIKIEGILVDLPKRDLRTCLSFKTFEKMTSLRLFINRNARFSGSLRYLSNELRVLDWPKCPLQSFPSNFHGKKLVVLRMQHNSPLRLLKDRFKDFQNLRILKFIQCKFLTEIPDISRSRNLEVLVVDGCESLVKVHNSVGFLNKLTTLHFLRCSNLITLPKSLTLRSLETLCFSYCARLQNIPEIGCKMEHLKMLIVWSCIAIKELPSFIGLSDLYIQGCKNLIHLPSSLQLQHPNILHHERRSKVVKLPTNVRDERESMLPVVSTEESEISSSTKLFASPPPANAYIFYDGSSSIASPALANLSIGNSPLKLLKMESKDFQNLTIMELNQCKFLTEIPDISRIPNLEVLKVDKCDSLVKVHDFVGFLDKLISMDFSRCSNLITLPRRLELRSLETLYFYNCARLQNFPEIGGKMERLRRLFLVKCIAIKELPSSIVYFTVLSQFSIHGCKNLPHISSSLQLQHPNILRHERRSKVVKLPTKVRDERESMLSVVSTEESKITSSTKLFASPPPANACIFDDGSSSIAFPALENLSVSKCTGLEKPEFFMTLDRFSSLQRLHLSAAPIVRLPACIKGFVRLKYLNLDHCRKLKEIPELPPNIEEILANGCVSLVSFPEISKIYQFNTSGLEEQKWIDLSGCYKLAENIGNQVGNTLLDKGLYNDDFDGGIVFPGNTIPACFSHRKEIPYGNYSCAIHINGLSNLDEIKGIAFCAVFGSRPGVRVSYKDVRPFRIGISRKGIEIGNIQRYFSFRDSNHVWLEYFVLEPFVLEEDNLQVEVFTSSKSIIKSWGVHMIYEHNEENAKDHPSLTHVDFNFCSEFSDDKVEYLHSSTSEDESDEENENSECSAEEDDFDEIERVLYGIQPSKRQRDAEDEDEDDCNLESSFYPQQKKRSSTMGESQLNQSDHSQC